MVERIPMTDTGYEKLRLELETLQRIERPEVIKAIEIARGHGDLRENAEYHAAKERQGHIEGRIIDLQDKLARAEIIDCTTIDCRKVVFGTVVTLVDLDTDEELRYQLLGPEESDVKKGSISVMSPFGSSMIGKVVGDEIVVRAPGGLRTLEIIAIDRPV